MDTLYRDKILVEYHSPKNYGLRDGFNREIKGTNPLCGDSITVRLKIEEEVIKDVCFESEGCVISKAAASLFSEYIKERRVDEIKNMSPVVIFDLLGVVIMPARYKCATLMLDTIKSVL